MYPLIFVCLFAYCWQLDCLSTLVVSWLKLNGILYFSKHMYSHFQSRLKIHYPTFVSDRTTWSQNLSKHQNFSVKILWKLQLTNSLVSLQGLWAILTWEKSCCLFSEIFLQKALQENSKAKQNKVSREQQRMHSAVKVHWDHLVTQSHTLAGILQYYRNIIGAAGTCHRSSWG